MEIVIEKTIDLTAYPGNPDPKVTSQLSIVHEARNGEIVQYFIDRRNFTEKDKNSYALSRHDEETDTWSYTDYGELEWGKPRSRISGNRIEHLSVKAFPNVGSIAVYKLMHRNISRIAAPVNPVKEKTDAPFLDVFVNGDGDVEFSITPPEEPEYDCYRIVMRNEEFSEDHITYDLTGILPAVHVSGEYEIFAIGYKHEAQISSHDSNTIILTLQGKEDDYEPPYYSKSSVKALIARVEALETELSGVAEELSDIVEVSDGND